MWRSQGSFAVALLLAATSLRGQTPTVEPVRITIIGASMSAGFVDPRPRADGGRNETVDLARVLRVVWPADLVKVRPRANVATFMNPEQLGGRQVTRAVKDDPDLVIAIDFPFWFGYGGQDEDWVLARQAKGLALLDDLKGPILVGDYPDMHGADPGMLPPSSVPSVELLAKLNDRLREWVARRDNAALFPLSAFAEEAREKGVVLDLPDGPRQAGVEQLLQADRLHPSRLGMAILGQRVVAAARALLPAGHPLREKVPTLTDFIEATGAGPVLEDLKAPAPAGGKRKAG